MAQNKCTIPRNSTQFHKYLIFSFSQLKRNSAQCKGGNESNHRANSAQRNSNWKLTMNPNILSVMSALPRAFRNLKTLLTITKTDTGGY